MWSIQEHLNLVNIKLGENAFRSMTVDEAAAMIMVAKMDSLMTFSGHSAMHLCIEQLLIVASIKLEALVFSNAIHGEAACMIQDTHEAPLMVYADDNSVYDLDYDGRADTVGVRYLTSSGALLQPPCTPVTNDYSFDASNVLGAVNHKLEFYNLNSERTSGLIRNGAYSNLAALNAGLGIDIDEQPVELAKSIDCNRGHYTRNISSSPSFSTPSFHGLSSEDGDSDEEEQELVISPRRRRL